MTEKQTRVSGIKNGVMYTWTLSQREENRYKYRHSITDHLDQNRDHCAPERDNNSF